MKIKHALRDMGRPVSRPNVKPLSGKIDRRLHAELTREAARGRISLAVYVEALLETCSGRPAQK